LTRPRLRDTRGQEVRLPLSTVSAPLRNCCLFWSNRLSFGDVARLVEQLSGAKLLSEDSLWRLCQQEAARLDAAQMALIQESTALPERNDMVSDTSSKCSSAFLTFCDQLLRVVSNS